VSHSGRFASAEPDKSYESDEPDEADEADEADEPGQ
jgi:hypothetical protein